MSEKKLETLVVTNEGSIVHNRTGSYLKINIIKAKPLGAPVIVGIDDFPYHERPAMVWLRSEAPPEANAYVRGPEYGGYIPIQFYKTEE
ncbi:MAG: hypothetical protein Q8R37_05140 [Nanoarchaeota archaeon]|nr:hypothetical protein [Nanoarchaeota archaeon]